MSKKFSKFKSFLNRWEWLILIIGLVVLLRVPSLFEPHHYGDEEIYFVMGRAWNQGVPMYAEAFDHKPPMIYILAGLTKTVLSFRTVLMLWMVAHTIIMWLLAEKFWGRKKQKLVFASTAIFALITTLPGLEGNIANAELFMMMPLGLALLLLWDVKKKQYNRYILAGLLVGFGLLFKIPVIFDFVALILLLWVFDKKTFMKSVKGLFSGRLWLMILAFTVPFVLTIINYYTKGSGPDYMRAAWGINLGYVSSWETGSYAFNPFKSGLAIRAMLLGAYTLVLYIFRNKLNKKLVFASLWFGFSLFGALLSGRPYPHYLLQPAMAFALLVPLVAVIRKPLEWLTMIMIVIAVVLTQSKIGFWVYPTINYYGDFWKGLTGEISKVEYRDTFSASKRNFVLAEYLNDKMTEEDQLYVWGSDASLYNLTNKLPAGGKYIVNFHVRDFRAYGEVMQRLEKNMPEYVVIMGDSFDFDELYEWLKLNYIVINEVDGTLVYHRI